MNTITGITRGGSKWVPKFIHAIDQEKCIGCGRCYKVCGRNIMSLIEKPFKGEDEYGDDMGNMVMVVKNLDDCIGCEACSRTCPKKCHTHTPLIV